MPSISPEAKPRTKKVPQLLTPWNHLFPTTNLESLDVEGELLVWKLLPGLRQLYSHGPFRASGRDQGETSAVHLLHFPSGRASKRSTRAAWAKTWRNTGGRQQAGSSVWVQWPRRFYIARPFFFSLPLCMFSRGRCRGFHTCGSAGAKCLSSPLISPRSELSHGGKRKKNRGEPPPQREVL